MTRILALPIPDSDQALTDELTRLAGHINAANYRFLKLLAALIERNAWGGDSGMKTPAHWLNYYCGIDLGAAREKVRVAKALQSLPQIDQAFASGAISYSKVRAMTRSATPNNEAALLNIARHGTAQHVEMLVRQHQRVQRLQQAKNNQPTTGHAERQLNWFYDEDGMLVIKGRFAAEEGAVLVKALEAALDAIEQDSLPEPTQETTQEPTQVPTPEPTPEQASDVSAETSSPEMAEPTFPRKRADALQLLGEHYLATRQQGPQPLTSADKYQVFIHLDAQTGHRTDVSSMAANIHDGPLLSDAASKRITCDASVVTVRRDDTGNVLNIGRKTRVVPPAIRRALTIRDGGCRHPGCVQTRYVDAHHIQHWRDGGETSLDNLVLLCRHHHRLLHEHAFSIEKTGNAENALRFLDQHGNEIKATPWPQFAKPSVDSKGHIELELDNAQRGIVIDSRTAITRWQGERMDCDMVIGVL